MLKKPDIQGTPDGRNYVLKALLNCLFKFNFEKKRFQPMPNGYDHHSLALFFELTRLLHSQYHLSVTRSFLAAYHAAHAVIFQPGKNRQDYERALPDIAP
jgi:hypothetical protein